MPQYQLTVNGKRAAVTVEPDTPLLYILRNDLKLNGPKFGCGLAQCGACSVLMGGNEVRSCVLPVARVNAEVTTLEGLGSIERPHPLQRAFIEEQACQCGYCGNGMVIAAKALLDRNPRPSEPQIRQALNGHLCRCASHNRIVRAVQKAAQAMSASMPAQRVMDHYVMNDDSLSTRRASPSLAGERMGVGASGVMSIETLDYDGTEAPV